ncbi:hypothetical protein ACSZN3_15585 [Aeromonas hydrophila]|uniref:hypothetical protein n=1 Tax=Aeromonas hydrophila TaxID=644 RepID=UPI003EC4D52A
MSKYGRNSIDIDAIKILQESNLEVGTETDGISTVGLFQIHNEVGYYREMLKYIAKLERMNYPPIIFGLVPKDGKPCGLTEDGVKLLAIVNNATLVFKHQKYYSLHPKLACLCNFIVKHGLHEMLELGPVDGKVREKLTEKLEVLLRELKSYQLMRQTYAFMKGARKNTVSLRKYVDGLFQCYSRLLVLRVDLSYKRKFRDSLSMDEILKHKDALLKNRRKGALAATWVGYACRLEYAPETGFHFHLLVFKNGADFRSDVFHAGLILDEWQRITGDRGRGFNCNMKAKDSEYRFCGIGVVNHDDKEKRQYLHKAVAYLTKSDLVAKLTLEKRRTFFKGTLPKKVTARGRPRVKTSTQSRQLVQQLRLVGV